MLPLLGSVALHSPLVYVNQTAELVASEVITASIWVNRRLELNTGRYAGIGSLAARETSFVCPSIMSI
jgi:hypothetical protein